MDLSLGKSKGLEQGISNRALHPTVFHNIRGRNDIFSSPGMNEDGSMYEGCWPGFQVPYHEWYHFAVTFTDEKMITYVNGDYVHSFNLSILANSSTKAHLCPYIYEDPKRATENTIFEIGGFRGRGMVGMIHNLFIVRNSALNKKEIQVLMAVNQPKIPAIWKPLLESYDIFSLQGVCSIQQAPNWKELSLFLVTGWGGCPEVVCGPVCYDEKFLLSWNKPMGEACKGGHCKFSTKTSQRLKAKGSLGISQNVVGAEKSGVKTEHRENHQRKNIGSTAKKNGHAKRRGRKDQYNHNQDLYDRHLEKVQILYDLAISWLGGRNRRILSSFRKEKPYSTEYARESAKAALILAFFIADDILIFDRQKSYEMDIHWDYKYPSIVSNPIRLVLGSLYGQDSASNTLPLPVTGIDTFRFSSVGEKLGFQLENNKELSSETQAQERNITAISICQKFAKPAAKRSIWRGWPTQEKRIGDSVLNTEAIDMIAKLDLTSLNETIDGRAILTEEAGQLLCEKFGSDIVVELFDVLDSTVGTVAMREPLETPEIKCEIVANLYFPITQYVASHFGQLESGVSVPQWVNLEGEEYGGFGGHLGEDDGLQIMEEAEARSGSANAQVWIALRYWWGYGALNPNPQLAREWFQRAADLNHPEGLYNIGVMYQNAQGGLPMNRTLAFHYFERAANHSNPFPMALHAVGMHYLAKSETSPEGEHDYALARKYLEQAAALGDANSFFTLALIHKDGKHGVPVDIKQSVVYLARGVSLGDVRSTNYLAHALFDRSSWLGHYARSLEGHGAKFDEQDQIIMDVGGKMLVLPSLKPHCPSAVTLMKYLTEHIFHVNDLSEEGVKLFAEGDLHDALDIFDELSELGIEIAQENAAYIYDILIQRECPTVQYIPADKELRAGEDSGLVEAVMVLWESIQGAYGAIYELFSFFSQLFSSETHITSGLSCNFLRQSAIRRLMQLARRGHARAIKSIAYRIGSGTTGCSSKSCELLLTLNGSALNVSSTAKTLMLFDSAASKGDSESMFQLGWVLYQKGNRKYFSSHPYFPSFALSF
jgi:TPR repeat protein